MTSTCIKATVLAGVLALSSSGVLAQEGEFLQSLDGNWSGDGTVKVRTNSSPISVKCAFRSDATDNTLTLDGNCRGLLIINRAIRADLKATGANYAGSYVGAGTGTAGLNGKRKGDAIHLGINWAKEVNGDRKAVMTVSRVGTNGMKLTTVDVDPKSGESVVTSQINLQRL